MKINKKMEDALNSQIGHEFYAKMLYLAMAAYFEQKNLTGFAHWFRKQAQEEDTHAMKIYDFVLDRDGMINLSAIEKPKGTFKNQLEIAQTALGHERRVTELINNLKELAQKEKDHATDVFMHWFVDERVEEEQQAQWLVDQLTMAGDSKSALLLIDRELGKRE